jgi:hypothetical protein
MNDDEMLRQRFVLGLDALPLLPAPGLRWGRAKSSAFEGFPLGRLAIGAALLLVLLFAAQLVLPGARPASTPGEPGFRDDFSTGIDRTKWTASIAGSGPTVAASDGRVELIVPASATAGADIVMSASLSPQNCVARGDYVVSADYELLDWPSMNGTDLLLHEVPPPDYGIDASITRFQNGDVDSIMGHSQINAKTIPVSGSTGSLRLTRHGRNVTASYRVGSGPWKDIPVAIASAGDARFRIVLVTDEGHFGRQQVRVAVDNFTLTAAGLTCG